jgi:hypothetical protein
MPLRTIALGGATVLVLVALAFPRNPSGPGPDNGGAEAQPVPLAAAPIAPPVAPSAPALSRGVSTPASKRAAAKPARNRDAESTNSGPAIAAAPPVSDIPFNEDAAKNLPGAETSAPPAPASVATRVGAAAPVTITGCLEISVNHDEFRLTDTEGLDAPRSRSWRTGFLKKRSAAVALVEPADDLALPTHVGRRVAATGLLTSHDLKVSALRVVGACN